MEGEIQSIEIEIQPSEKLLSGLLTRAVTGVNSRAVTPPLERGKEKTRKKMKDEKQGANGSAPPPLFRRLPGEQIPAEAPARPLTPPPRSPAAASGTQMFIEELRKIGSNIELHREERREMKEKSSLSYWKQLLKNKNNEDFTDIGEEDYEGTPTGAIQFYARQVQEYLKTEREDWTKLSMKKGLMIHVERFLEAEHKNATLHKAYDDLNDRMDRVDNVLKECAQERNELKKCVFVHSFRCERYKEALEKQGKELEELEKKLQYETSRRKDTQRYYENLFIAKTGYEKLARQEHQSKQDKKINELQAELNLVQAQNKCKEGEIRSLKNQAARGRTYSLLGFQVILPF